MGVQPDLGAGYLDYRQPEIKAHFERIYGTGIPTQPGLKIPQMFDAARAGKLKALWIMGEDILQTDPNSCEVKYSLGMISLVDLEWSVVFVGIDDLKWIGVKGDFPLS